MTDIKLEILPSGHIKFKRGSKKYNAKVRQVISHLVDNDEEIMSNIDEFLIGSEESELLIGDTILCG
jgi:hypothetical protein